MSSSGGSIKVPRRRGSALSAGCWCELLRDTYKVLLIIADVHAEPPRRTAADGMYGGVIVGQVLACRRRDHYGHREEQGEGKRFRSMSLIKGNWRGRRRLVSIIIYLPLALDEVLLSRRMFLPYSDPMRRPPCGFLQFFCYLKTHCFRC
jgi:hypothetical protein